MRIYDEIRCLFFTVRWTFVSFIPNFVFGFWSLLVTKIRKYEKILHNLCLHFARQEGQDGKNRKENHASKVTLIPKTKRRKYEMNETFVKNLTH